MLGVVVDLEHTSHEALKLAGDPLAAVFRPAFEEGGGDEVVDTIQSAPTIRGSIGGTTNSLPGRRSSRPRGSVCRAARLCLGDLGVPGDAPDDEPANRLVRVEVHRSGDPQLLPAPPVGGLVLEGRLVHRDLHLVEDLLDDRDDERCLRREMPVSETPARAATSENGTSPPVSTRECAGRIDEPLARTLASLSELRA